MHNHPHVSRTRRHGKHREAVMARDGSVCHLCGGPHADAIDHIVPVAWGGSDDPSNLAPAHTSCNSSKSDARPDAWTWNRPGMWLPGYGPNLGSVDSVGSRPRVEIKAWGWGWILLWVLFSLVVGLVWAVQAGMGSDVPGVAPWLVMLFLPAWGPLIGFGWRWLTNRSSAGNSQAAAPLSDAERFEEYAENRQDMRRKLNEALAVLSDAEWRSRQDRDGLDEVFAGMRSLLKTAAEAEAMRSEEIAAWRDQIDSIDRLR